MKKDAFSKYYKTLNVQLKGISKLNEAPSLFKGGRLQSKKTNTFFHWKYGEKPALFDIDFKYTVTFDIKKIKDDYENGDRVDWNEFYRNNIKPNFSEPGLWKKARSIDTPNFKVAYVIYNSEFTDRTLNPRRNSKYKFAHTITLEAKDKNKEFKKVDIQKDAQDFINKAESILFANNKYYKITK